jgi:hypothetical protein
MFYRVVCHQSIKRRADALTTNVCAVAAYHELASGVSLTAEIAVISHGVPLNAFAIDLCPC